MAIIKFSSSHNKRYSDVLEYLTYKHHEDPKTGLYEPVLDELGLLQERDDYAVCYINPYGQEKPPEQWAANCCKTNLAFNKNQAKGDRKQMSYVISHPTADRPKMTMEDLLAEGRAFVHDNLQGYDVLIAVHRDTDNDHIHVAFNSVRATERAIQPWMMKNEDGQPLRCEYCAGGKHQNSPELRRYLYDWLRDYTRDHGLTVEDNNRVADERKQARYQEKNENMRDIFLDTAKQCYTLPELQRRLQSEHQITLKIRGSTLSLVGPHQQKAVRLKTLGIMPEDIPILHNYLQNMTEKNAVRIERTQEVKRTNIQKKAYIEWIQYRRQKNSDKAEALMGTAYAAIQKRLSSTLLPFRKSQLRELNQLLRRTVYTQRDLLTELDKIDRLLDRWTLLADPSLSENARKEHEGYVKWCGYDPESKSQLAELQTERRVVELQIRETEALREALVESSIDWWGHCRLEWDGIRPLTEEEQLQTKLTDLKAHRKKLGEMAYNCQKAANRHIYNEDLLAKAKKFRTQWAKELEQEKFLKQQLKEVRRNGTRSDVPFSLE